MNTIYRAACTMLALGLALCVSPIAVGAPSDLDLTFGSTGKVTTAFGSGSDTAYSMALQSDGKIVVVGVTNSGIGGCAVARYNSDGSLDTSFNLTGKLTTPGIDGKSVTVQSDGKIVVAGISGYTFYVNGLPRLGIQFAVVRYNSNGTLDTSFNGTGIVVTAVDNAGENRGDQCYGVAVQSDGKIVLAGSSHVGQFDTYDIALVRYNANGSLDPTFNGNGIVTTDIPAVFPAPDEAYCVALQNDGKIVVAGSSGYSGGFIAPLHPTALSLTISGACIAVLRYNTDGSLDTSFNGTGKVLTRVNDGDKSSKQDGRSVTIQSDGRIVVSGSGLVRLEASGALDLSVPFATNSSAAVVGYGAAVQSNSKIAVAIDFHNGSNYDFALWRYDTSGSLDTTFNGTGKVVTAIGTGNDNARSIAIQRDGKIVVAGTSYNGANSVFALVRYQGDPPVLNITTRNLDDTADADPVLEPSILRVPNIPALQIDAFKKRRNGRLLKIKGPPDTQLRAYITPGADSAGHDHDLVGRRHGWLAPSYSNTGNFPPYLEYKHQPSFQSGGTTDYSSYDDPHPYPANANQYPPVPTSFATDANGNAAVYYIAPEISGQDIVTISTNDPDPNARIIGTLPITIGVGLPFGPFLETIDTEDVELTGATDTHYRPYYVTEAMNVAMTALAQNYCAQYQRDPTSLPSPLMPVNDMSLIYGGLFDSDANWTGEGNNGHLGHRLGLEVDIGGLNTGHGLVPGEYPAFDLMWQEQGWFKPVEEGDHFHFVFDGPGRVSMAFPDPPEILLSNATARTIYLRVPMENQGSLDADNVFITRLHATGGALITSPLMPYFAGDAPIRAPRWFDVEIEVPEWLESFFLFGGGIATSIDTPGTEFPVPSALRPLDFYPIIQVPSSFKETLNKARFSNFSLG